MFICYLDESGEPQASANTTHFILLGLAIPAETWKRKDAQVSDIKAKYGLHNAEIHTAWMARDYPEQSRVPAFEGMEREHRRRAVQGVRDLNLARPRTNTQQRTLIKNYRETEAYIHLTRAERVTCLLELCKLVGSWSDARLFGEARDKVNAPGQKAFDESFEQVVTRLNAFLEHRGEMGLLVQDNNPTVAARLTATMRRFHKEGTLWATVDRIVETPMFVDSQLTQMVQLADLCAYATRRFFERGERDLFDAVFPTFDRQGSVLVGLRHYTRGFLCKCKVCHAHGRYQRPTRKR